MKKSICSLPWPDDNDINSNRCAQYGNDDLCDDIATEPYKTQNANR